MTIQPTSDLGARDGATNHPGVQRSQGKLLATQGYVVGIEISGNGVRQSVALSDLNGTVLHRIRRPLESVLDTQAVLNLLSEMLAEATRPELLRNGRLLRVGIAVGGLVDAKLGVVNGLHHASGWKKFPLQDYFADKLGVPCIIENNANAAALAETLYGAGVGERVVLYIALGRGIGGGLIVNGKIYHGTTCTAGEIGHMIVQEQGAICSCGRSGHLETIASARAIVHRLLALSKEYPETKAAVSRMTDGSAERLTAEQVFRLAADGDPIAQNVVHDVHIHLGNALVNMVLLINPSMIVLGGPVARAGDLLLVPLRERIQESCLPEATRSLRIVQGNLGSDANLVGAVTLALQDV